MSQENVEVVRSVFEPLEGINLAAIDWGLDEVRDALGQAYSPDVQLTTLASGVATGVESFYEGPDGVVAYLRAWFEPFSEYFVDNLDFFEEGGSVLVPSRQWGVGASSGVRTEIELTTLYEVRDGKIVRLHQFDTLAEAKEAAQA